VVKEPENEHIGVPVANPVLKEISMTKKYDLELRSIGPQLLISDVVSFFAWDFLNDKDSKAQIIKATLKSLRRRLAILSRPQLQWHCCEGLDLLLDEFLVRYGSTFKHIHQDQAKPDPNWKIRITTKSNLFTELALGKLNSFLTSRTKTPEFNVWTMPGSLRTTAVKRMLTSALETDELYNISIDQEKATDHIYQKWVSFIIDRIALHVSPMERVFLLSFKDRYAVHCHNPSGDCSTPVQRSWFRETRGIAMGLPLSFSILSILSYVISDFEAGILDEGRPVVTPACKMGDDILVRCSRSDYTVLLSRCKALGFVLNGKKTYVHKTKGLFCEEIFEIDPIGGVTQKPKFPIALTAPSQDSWMISKWRDLLRLYQNTRDKHRRLHLKSYIQSSSEFKTLLYEKVHLGRLFGIRVPGLYSKNQREAMNIKDEHRFRGLLLGKKMISRGNLDDLFVQTTGKPVSLRALSQINSRFIRGVVSSMKYQEDEEVVDAMRNPTADVLKQLRVRQSGDVIRLVEHVHKYRQRKQPDLSKFSDSGHGLLLKEAKREGRLLEAREIRSMLGKKIYSKASDNVLLSNILRLVSSHSMDCGGTIHVNALHTTSNKFLRTYNDEDEVFTWRAPPLQSDE